jgi:hypothetical protein
MDDNDVRVGPNPPEDLPAAGHRISLADYNQLPREYGWGEHNELWQVVEGRRVTADEWRRLASEFGTYEYTGSRTRNGNHMVFLEVDRFTQQLDRDRPVIIRPTPGSDGLLSGLRASPVRLMEIEGPMAWRNTQPRRHPNSPRLPAGSSTGQPGQENAPQRSRRSGRGFGL